MLFGTFNRNKIAEFDAIISAAGLSVRLLSPADIGISAEPEETGATFAENAREKAIYFSKAAPVPVIAEDSGLCVDAIDGWPGVQSKRAAKTDRERIAVLLAKLNGIPLERRTARFVCSAAVAIAGEIVYFVERSTEGIIAFESAGEGGFGYDPVFYYPPAGMTFAQMTRAQKSEVSHRGKALSDVCSWIGKTDIK